MRLTAAFFANRAEVVDEMLNVEGGFWASTTVAPNANAFRADTVILCEVDDDDIGQEYTLNIDCESPTGRRARVYSSRFTVTSRLMFMCLPAMVMPVEPGGGFHLYGFHLDGQHERVDVRLAVRPSFA